MSLIRIETKKYSDFLRERLLFEIDILKEDGTIIEIDEEKQGDAIIFNCKLVTENNNFEDEVAIFREYIANILSDLIINRFEEDLLHKILKRNYQHFTPEDEKKLIELASDRLNYLESKDDGAIISQIQRKNRILLEIVDYLTIKDVIILEGFVRFRLGEYISELQLAVDQAVNDLAVEREYEEFVYLLKHFVENQDPKIELINVVKTEQNKFEFLNQFGTVLKNSYLDDDILNLMEEDLDYQDLLISALITLAPQEIVLHFKEPAEAVETIEGIFAERVCICMGCKYCEIDSLNELE
ncbi:putative sporulation protein YtxC [Natroniella sulfidigena]|uniref:putative sporulation protein YtxC n=1 Tax=Natroniella sulfidigena TaxID=723921 RepID=UPI00200B4327|nr:putative sporulation protein YtxC [Natroniella sulfidigena]MCK8817118.1 putative sporulation protein YtxC [Natroniella sulfidigena]